jgi:hypothetical protein
MRDLSYDAGSRWLNPVLFLLFFCSGFCSLVYQVVWLRLAFAHFGIVTPVLSVVLSVFMLGLGAGSLLAGRSARHLFPLSSPSGNGCCCRWARQVPRAICCCPPWPSPPPSSRGA